jgi:hypothetical protein
MAGESAPGIHGGIAPLFVIIKIAFEYAAAVRADVIENGAIAPWRWQPAHLAAKIGATSFQVGMEVPAALAPREWLAPATTAATARSTAAATAILRLTP